MAYLRQGSDRLKVPPKDDPQTAMRRMRRADLREVARIEALSFPSPWPAAYFRDCLEAGFECWVLENDRRIDGYAVMSTARAVAHLMNICIAPSARRRGLGRRLLALMIRIAEQLTQSMVLEVRSSNRAAVELYRSMGFREAGLRKGYYPTPAGREDALVLRLPLSGTGAIGTDRSPKT